MANGTEGFSFEDYLNISLYFTGTQWILDRVVSQYFCNFLLTCNCNTNRRRLFQKRKVMSALNENLAMLSSFFLVVWTHLRLWRSVQRQSWVLTFMLSLEGLYVDRYSSNLKRWAVDQLFDADSWAANAAWRTYIQTWGTTFQPSCQCWEITVCTSWS